MNTIAFILKTASDKSFANRYANRVHVNNVNVLKIHASLDIVQITEHQDTL